MIMKTSDLTILLNGLEIVGRAFLKINRAEISKVVENSSITTLSKSVASSLEDVLSSTIAQSDKKTSLKYLAKEVVERTSVVAETAKQYSAFVLKPTPSVLKEDFEIDHPILRDEDISNLKSEHHEKLSRLEESEHNEEVSHLQENEPHEEVSPLRDPSQTEQNAGSPFSTPISNDIPSVSTQTPEVTRLLKTPTKKPQVYALSKLSEKARERKVPSNRLQRSTTFAVLGLKLAKNTASEYIKTNLFRMDTKTSAKNPLMIEENINLLVDTLCKVRGAALKLGQMLSIQDTALIDPKFAAIFERVRQSADFMPTWQMENVMASEWGNNWREKVSRFEDKPFAAASIGQVHQAKLLDGTDVAVKIQYPGVAKGIESDIKNMQTLIEKWNIIPKGMYMDNVMAVAKRELRKEVDYINEAASGKKFKKILEKYPEYVVPEVYEEMCTRNVLTTELVSGKPVDKLESEDQDIRNQVCERLLRLCLMEIFHFRYMQTDPNWSNFLYNLDTQQIVLLDFGACNEYTPQFVDTYMKIIKGSADQNREDVLHYSRELKFLSGYEDKIMEEAHVNAVMILGEAFACRKPFDFKHQNMTERIHDLVPIMLKHRLQPPPEETYSLHRKMSGIFLLCAKLGAIIDCSKLFDDVYNEYLTRKSIGANTQG